jgi:hypothetical protein
VDKSGDKIATNKSDLIRFNFLKNLRLTKPLVKTEMWSNLNIRKQERRNEVSKATTEEKRLSRGGVIESLILSRYFVITAKVVIKSWSPRQRLVAARPLGTNRAVFPFGE